MAGYRFKEDDGKSTIALIGILLVLIFIVGGALIYILTQKGGEAVPPLANGTKPPQNVTNVTNITNATGACEGECLLEKALSEKNVSACAMMGNLSQQCYEGLSGESLEACEAVLNVTRKMACMTAFAVGRNNMSLCERLAAGADACRLAVDPCYNASDKSLCRALEEGDPSRCGSNSMCLLNYSMAKSDPGACALIENNVVSAACKSAAGRTDKCSGLPQQSERDYCYELFAIYTNDYLTCTQTTPNSIYALDCYSLFAARLEQVSFCDDDGLGLNERWQCYTNYSLLSGNLSGCERIDALATTSRFTCFFEYAKAYGNPAACDSIGDASGRSTCYEGAIIYSNQNLDWHHCRDVTSFKWMNQCYTAAAKLYDDVTMCDYISESFAKESCIDSYEVYKKK